MSAEADCGADALSPGLLGAPPPDVPEHHGILKRRVQLELEPKAEAQAPGKAGQPDGPAAKRPPQLHFLGHVEDIPRKRLPRAGARGGGAAG